MSIHRRILQGLGWAEVGDAYTEEDWPLVPGSVTNPTGSVSGNSLTGLQGAYSGHWGGITCPAGAAMAQWQMAVLLSSADDPCGTGSPFLANELHVRLVLTGYKELPDCAAVYPPATDLPITLTVPIVNHDTSEGVHLVARAYFNKAKSNGSGGNDVEATGGTWTFTRMDNSQYEGSVSLTFPNEGSFSCSGYVAPWCGTPPSNP